jgi:hypothetical protein
MTMRVGIEARAHYSSGYLVASRTSRVLRSVLTFLRRFMLATRDGTCHLERTPMLTRLCHAWFLSMFQGYCEGNLNNAASLAI